MIPGFDRYWAELVRPYFDTTSELRAILEILGPLPGQKIVDLGCGHGRFAPGLTAAGLDYLGIDSSKELLEMVTAGQWIHGDCADVLISAGESRFHHALSWFGSFGFASRADDARLFGAVHGALLPGGRFLIGTLNPLFPWTPGDVVRDVSDGSIVIERCPGFNAETSSLVTDRFVLLRRPEGGFDLGQWSQTTQILYPYPELRQMLLDAGFARVRLVRGDSAAFQTIVLAERA